MNPGIDFFKASTRLTQLSIRQSGDTLELRTGGDALQSAIDVTQPHRIALKNLEYLVGILLFQRAPANILMLGTGAGSLIHFFRRYFSETHITAVDIDVELLQHMHQHMLLPQADDRLGYVIDDADHYLQNCQQHYDLIVVDIFTGNRSPDWLLEPDSMQELRRLTAPNGAISYNLLIESEHEFNRFYRNLRQVFQQNTACVGLESFDNTIAYALNSPLAQRQMSALMQIAVDLGEQHDMDYLEILSAIYTTNPVGSGII